MGSKGRFVDKIQSEIYFFSRLFDPVLQFVKFIAVEKLSRQASNADGTRLAFYEVAYLSKLDEPNLFKEDNT